MSKPKLISSIIYLLSTFNRFLVFRNDSVFCHFDDRRNLYNKSKVKRQNQIRFLPLSICYQLFNRFLVPRNDSIFVISTIGEISAISQKWKVKTQNWFLPLSISYQLLVRFLVPRNDSIFVISTIGEICCLIQYPKLVSSIIYFLLTNHQIPRSSEW